jgi:bifunctional DNase/RNase
MTLKKSVWRRRKFIMPIAVSIEEVIKGMRRIMNMKTKIWMQHDVVTNLKERWRVLVMVN